MHNKKDSAQCLRRSELEKESVDWTELIEKTVDFAQYA
jgi:hypothetical protein